MGNEDEDVHEEIPEPSIPAPWLVFEHLDVGFTFSTCYLDNKSSSSYFLKNTPELDDKFTVASQFDWLILYDLLVDMDDSYSISLWNPSTSKYIKLPPLHHVKDTPRRETYFLLSPPQLNGNSFVFVFFVGVVFVCQCTGDGWVSERIEIEGERVFVYRAFTLDGTVYCWATDNSSGTKTRLVSIQVIIGSGSNPLSLVVNYLPIRLPHELFSNILETSSNHILESCGSIYIAQVGTHNFNWTQNVKVWKLDLELQSIVPVKSIGDRAFFLSYLSNTWSYATNKDDYDHQFDFTTGGGAAGGVQANCLYFHDVDITRDAVILYSLDDCTTTYLPCPTLRDPCSPNAYWVMPLLPPRRPECSKQGSDNDNVAPESSCILEGTKEGNDEVVQWSKQGDYLTQLPEDLIRLIAKFMHLFDYWNFRSSCKKIQAATCAPGWRTNNLYPLFLVYENDAGSCRVMDPCRYDSRPCVIQLSQEYFGIEFSKNGWLLISHGNRRLQFFNPFTRACLKLPPLGYFAKIGFSTNPTSPGCLTVTISRSTAGGVVFNYHRYGDQKWTSRHFDKTQNIEFQAWDGSHVYHSGVFYFLDKVGYLGVLEWTNDDQQEEITWTIHQPPLAQARDSHSLYLLNHGQQLVAVVIGKLGKYVSVFSFDHQNKTWMDVQSLGNHVLFLSPYSSSSIATTDVKMHDRIYLPWIKRKRIIYYSLKTLKYHTDDGCDFACLDFFFIKNPSRCCWI